MITAEKLKHHISHLQERHDALDQLIADEYARYQDDRAIASLKKEKLALKDEIEKFKKDLNTL